MAKIDRKRPTWKVINDWGMCILARSRKEALHLANKSVDLDHDESFGNITMRFIIQRGESMTNKELKKLNLRRSF